MASNSFKVKNSLNVAPTATAGTEAGDLRADSSDSNKMTWHNGTAEDTVAMTADLTAHTADAAGAHAATAISSTPAGNLAATTVQAALDELQTDIDTRATATALTDHTGDTTGAHAASAISVTPSGNLAADDVAEALNELQTDIDTRAVATDLSDHIADTSTHGVSGAIVGTTDTQTLTNKTVGIADGLVGTPSLNFTSDTDTGIFRSTTDTMELVAGANSGLQVKKSTGAFANVGIGGSASTSDNFPVLIQRTNSTGVSVQISNPSAGASAGTRLLLKSDTGSASGAQYSSYPAAATTHAYTNRAVFGATNASVGTSIVAGDQATGDIRFYNVGYASTNESLRLNPDYSMQFMQQIATPATPASNTVKMYQKSDDALYVLNDAGTETKIRTGTVAIADGGTGQTTAQAAIDALVPTQTGNSGEFLTTNGTTVSWASPAGAAKSFRSVTTTDSPTSSDDILACSGASFTMTLFTAAGNTGKIIEIIHNGTSLSQIYTLATTSSQTIGGIAGGSYALYTNGEVLKLVSDGSNWLILDHRTNTDWTAFPSVAEGVLITATTTAPEYGDSGTPTINAAKWRRVGRHAEVLWDYRQVATTGSNAGSGLYLFNLPTGLHLDTTVAPANTETTGGGDFADSHVGTFALAYTTGAAATGFASPYSSSQLKFQYAGTNGASPIQNVWGSAAATFTTAAAFEVHVRALIPVSGWQP